MLSREEFESLKILMDEFRRINNYPELTSVGLLDENDYYNWRALLFGPNNTPYENGIFQIKIEFPKNYSESGPKVIFLTPIYIPNIDSYGSLKGKICLPYLNSVRNNCNDSIIRMFIYLYDNFYSPINCGHNKEAYIEYNNKRNLFNKKARYFTNKYANPDSVSVDKYWCFSVDEKDLELMNNLPKLKCNYNFNDNSFICLHIEYFLLCDRGDIIIKCKLNELAGNVIQRAFDKKKISNNERLLVFHGNNKIYMNISIGENGLYDNSKIIIIDDIY